MNKRRERAYKDFSTPQIIKKLNIVLIKTIVQTNKQTPRSPEKIDHTF